METNNQDILEFENALQALKHYSGKLLQKEIVVSQNLKNKDTYKKELIELHPVFFKLKNPKAVIFKHSDFKCLPYWVISEIITEMLGMNPPLMNNYRQDIVAWSYDLLVSGRACYSYGARWLNFCSLEKTYERLKENPTSKRCYVPIYDQADVGESIDAPCNLGFLFLIRNNKLDLTLFCRSIDITKGFRYDLSLFSFIQQSMASFLNVEIGDFYYYCNSLHCYGENIELLKKINNSPIYETTQICELEIDKNMDISKFYEDLRQIEEIEVLIRNKGDIETIFAKMEMLNYAFARDFIRIFLLKNQRAIELEVDFETKIGEWYL